MFLSRFAFVLLVPTLAYSGNNTIAIDQSGADLGVTVEQNGNATMAAANIVQLGDSNELSLLQQSCIDCSADLQQSGTRNHLSINQIDSTASTIAAIQQGDGNAIDISTTGNAIAIDLFQQGADNSVDMAISANDSSIAVNQEGTSNTLTVSNIDSASTVRIDQIGNGNSIELINGRPVGHSGITVTQSSNGARLTISQY